MIGTTTQLEKLVAAQRASPAAVATDKKVYIALLPTSCLLSRTSARVPTSAEQHTRAQFAVVACASEGRKEDGSWLRGRRDDTTLCPLTLAPTVVVAAAVGRQVVTILRAHSCVRPAQIDFLYMMVMQCQDIAARVPAIIDRLVTLRAIHQEVPRRTLTPIYPPTHRRRALHFLIHVGELLLRPFSSRSGKAQVYYWGVQRVPLEPRGKRQKGPDSDAASGVVMGLLRVSVRAGG